MCGCVLSPLIRFGFESTHRPLAALPRPIASRARSRTRQGPRRPPRFAIVRVRSRSTRTRSRSGLTATRWRRRARSRRGNLLLLLLDLAKSRKVCTTSSAGEGSHRTRCSSTARRASATFGRATLRTRSTAATVGEPTLGGSSRSRVVCRAGTSRLGTTARPSYGASITRGTDSDCERKRERERPRREPGMARST